MIAWSIIAARESACFDRVIVSTDDPEIAEVANDHGAEVPFVRPAELSDDNTATIPVICHAIEWLKARGMSPEEVCCIYATAPFMKARDLTAGLELLRKTGCEYIFPVTSFAFPIQRAVRINTQGRIEMFDPSHFATRSQDLEEAFHDAGQFYWGMADTWLTQKVFYSPNSAPLVLPRYRVQDIDTPEDWERAEWMFEALRKDG